MTAEIISRSISTKVWYRAGIELATPGSAVRHASVARHVTDCATLPGLSDRVLEVEGPLIGDSSETLCCVLEHYFFSSAWFNPEKVLTGLVMHYVALYPPHHVKYAPVKFEVAMSSSFGRYAFARKYDI